MDEKRGDLFDVAMGAYDGAEVCELVGTFLLEKISEISNKCDIGLYRDDGLAVFRNKSGTHLKKIKKKLQILFKQYHLEIIVESNQNIVNYLDVTLNLKDATFRPYHKPSDQMQYIHTESNHPPNIIKHITASIETVYQTYSPLKQYSKNQQHTSKIICGNLDTIRNYHINRETLSIKNILSIREKSYGLIHRLARMFLQKLVNLF